MSVCYDTKKIVAKPTAISQRCLQERGCNIKGFKQDRLLVVAYLSSIHFFPGRLFEMTNICDNYLRASIRSRLLAMVFFGNRLTAAVNRNVQARKRKGFTKPES